MTDKTTPSQRIEIQLRLEKLATADADMFDNLKGQRVIVNRQTISSFCGYLDSNGQDFVKLTDVREYHTFMKAIIEAEIEGQSSRAIQGEYDSIVLNKSDISEIFAVRDYQARP
mgnify:CR=1 FL=1